MGDYVFERGGSAAQSRNFTANAAGNRKFLRAAALNRDGCADEVG